MSDAKTFFGEWERVIKSREMVTEADGEDPPLPNFDAAPAIAVAPCERCGVAEYGHDDALCAATCERDLARAEARRERKRADETERSRSQPAFWPGQMVTLVASVRHEAVMREVEWRLAARGVLVWPVTIVRAGDAAAQEAACRAHYERIRRSHAVVAIDLGGELGEHSARAVHYAQALGVPVHRLSVLAAADPGGWDGCAAASNAELVLRQAARDYLTAVREDEAAQHTTGTARGIIARQRDAGAALRRAEQALRAALNDDNRGAAYAGEMGACGYGSLHPRGAP